MKELYSDRLVRRGEDDFALRLRYRTFKGERIVIVGIMGALIFLLSVAPESASFACWNPSMNFSPEAITRSEPEERINGTTLRASALYFW